MSYVRLTHGGSLPGTISTVVFDLDDTLIGSARARHRAYRSFPELGIDPRQAEAANARWWERYYRGECSLAQLRQNRWVDLGLSPALALEVDAQFRQHHENIRARRGARSILEQLHQANLKIVILSNAGIDYIQGRVTALGAEHLIDGIVNMEESVWKPHPDAFQSALDLVGGSARHSAMVGDKLDIDVIGALNAGFSDAVWLSNRKPYPHPRVTTVSCLVAAEIHLLRLAQP